MTAGPVPGHDGGPACDAGVAWQAQGWRSARAALLPALLPVEVVRLRGARARALGLPYRTRAGSPRRRGRS